MSNAESDGAAYGLDGIFWESLVVFGILNIKSQRPSLEADHIPHGLFNYHQNICSYPNFENIDSHSEFLADFARVD